MGDQPQRNESRGGGSYHEEEEDSPLFTARLRMLPIDPPFLPPAGRPLKSASSIGNILSLAPSKPPSFTDFAKFDLEEGEEHQRPLHPRRKSKLRDDSSRNPPQSTNLLGRTGGGGEVMKSSSSLSPNYKVTTVTQGDIDSATTRLSSTLSSDRQRRTAAKENANDELDSIHNGTALIRWWKPFVGFAWAFFVAFLVAMALDRAYSDDPLCPYSDRHYGDWYWYTCYAVFGGFLLILSVLLIRLVQVRHFTNKRIPLIVAINIVVMSSIATLLAVVFELGGVCIDTLDVASPAAIWAEWMACGPLLFFITFTVIDKPNLSLSDWFFMVMFFLCLLTAFFIIPPQPIESGQFWLAVSCVTYAPVLVVPWYDPDGGFMDRLIITKNSASSKIQSVYDGSGGRQSLGAAAEGRGDEDRQIQVFAQRYAMRYNLAMWLEIILPIFTVNYVIAVFGGIDHATTIAIFQIISVTTKGLFAACTMDIHLDLLIEAEKALIEERRANEARRAFMKYIFHEVRTPLNSLTMGIDLLNMSSNLDHLDRESLGMMKAASEFMSNTLDDVLSMQKIEEGKLELEMTPFSFEKTIKKVFATFRGAVTKKEITLYKSISPNTPASVLGDIHRIEHIMSNLLSNAIKFSPEGKSVRLQVITESISPATAADKKDIARIRVSIKDEGPGISNEDQSLLFDSFVQIRPGTLQSGQGSGLGLSFCKQIVQLHGGEVGITSEVGKGSEFFFTIPYGVHAYGSESEAVVGEGDRILSLHRTSPELIISQQSPVNRSRSDTANILSSMPPHPPPPGVVVRQDGIDEGKSTAGITPLSINMALAARNLVVSNGKASDEDDSKFEVLVVDDADSNRKMLTMLLKRKGLVSETAENGFIAVNIVKENLHRFKLVLMDNLMPVMNGVEAARAMRDAGFPYLIAGITGNVMEDDIEEYLDAGADLVIPKPLKRSTLDLLVGHIDETDAISRPGMRLLEQEDRMEWVNRGKNH